VSLNLHWPDSRIVFAGVDLLQPRNDLLEFFAASTYGPVNVARDSSSIVIFEVGR